MSPADFLVVETPRLKLIGLYPENIQYLFQTKTHEEIKAFLGTNDQEFERYLGMFNEGMRMHRITHFYFIIYLKNEDRPIGECGFHTWNTVHQKAEIFYLLRNDSDKRQGFMKEALEIVIPFGFENLNLHRIQALVSEDNEASLKLIHHFNFVKEGRMIQDYKVGDVFEDSLLFSLIKTNN